VTIYDYTARTIGGESLPLAMFRGQVCLVVNIASECGYTPQLEGLESLYRTYHRERFTVLGFPCNQFGLQEPGDEPAILAFCTSRYGVTFPLFAKIEVNGPAAHPLFDYLTRTRRGLLGTRRIKWNFTKFLVGRDGIPLRRFGPKTRPAETAGAIEDAIGRIPAALAH
jgi:glutathione peroxidase